MWNMMERAEAFPPLKTCILRSDWTIMSSALPFQRTSTLVDWSTPSSSRNSNSSGQWSQASRLHSTRFSTTPMLSMSIQAPSRTGKAHITQNRSLFTPNSTSELRRPLLEHYDFEALSSSMWRYLKSWYGCDVAVTRLLIRDRSNPTKYVLDLYPVYRKTPPPRSHLSEGA